MGIVRWLHFHLLGQQALSALVEPVEGQQGDVHGAVVGEEPHHPLRPIVHAEANQKQAQRLEGLQLTEPRAVPVLEVLDLVDAVST